MKRLETVEKKIGENTFYIRPFSAFAAVSISGELTALLAPLAVGLVPALNGGSSDEGDSTDGGADFLSTDINDILPVLANAAASLSGDKVARIMSALLIDHENISIEGEATDGAARKLTKDLADEVFCMDLQDMLVLCYEVVKLNFGGMFGKFSEKASSLAAVKAAASAEA